MTGVLVFLAVFLMLALRAAAVLRARQERARFADRRVLALMVGEPSPALNVLRAVALTLGAAALGLTVFGASGEAGERPDSAGLETVLVLDASNSMLAGDIVPNRLALQQEIAQGLIASLPGRIGIVYFAGRGYVLSPLTTDREAALMYAESVHPAVVGRGGSALASGLVQALEVLEGGEGTERQGIVLITDGESTAGEDQELLDATERAARAGVPVHAVGLGTREGGRIAAAAAVGLAGRRVGPEGSFLRGPDGEIVVTKLEDDVLKSIARETDGSYEVAGENTVRRIVSRLSLSGREDGPANAGFANLFLVLAFLALWAEGFVAVRS